MKKHNYKKKGGEKKRRGEGGENPNQGSQHQRQGAKWVDTSNSGDTRERKQGRGTGEERDIGGYTLDTSLVKGVGALKTCFEPDTIEQLICDGGILLTVRCMSFSSLFARLRKSACSTFFFGVLPEKSKLCNITGEVSIAALQLSSGDIESGRLS